MLKIIVDTIVIFFGLLDNAKYLIQARKTIECQDINSLSESFLIISIITRLVVMIYAYYIKNIVFTIIYAMGFLATLYCYNIYLKIKNNHRGKK